MNIKIRCLLLTMLFAAAMVLSACSSESGNSGSKQGDEKKVEYNVEYVLSYSEADTDDDGTPDYTNYYDNSDGKCDMYVTFCESSHDIVGPAVEYWMNCFAYDGEFYGNRPYDEPSGHIENLFGYDFEGNITEGMISEDSYIDYSFDSPVVYDAKSKTYYHFVRVSDKLFY